MRIFIQKKNNYFFWYFFQTNWISAFKKLFRFFLIPILKIRHVTKKKFLNEKKSKNHTTVIILLKPQSKTKIFHSRGKKKRQNSWAVTYKTITDSNNNVAQYLVLIYSYTRVLNHSPQAKEKTAIFIKKIKNPKRDRKKAIFSVFLIFC